MFGEFCVGQIFEIDYCDGALARSDQKIGVVETCSVRLQRQLHLKLMSIFAAADIPEPNKVIKTKSHQAPLLLDPKDAADRSIMKADSCYFVAGKINGGNIPRCHAYEQDAVLVDVAAEHRMLQKHLPHSLPFSTRSVHPRS